MGVKVGSTSVAAAAIVGELDIGGKAVRSLNGGNLCTIQRVLLCQKLDW